MKAILVAAMFMPMLASASDIPDFHDLDKQAHALAGCSISMMVRSAATDMGSNHPALWGVGLGSAVALTRTLATEEKRQDAMAHVVGSVACIGIAEGISLVVGRNNVGVNVGF